MLGLQSWPCSLFLLLVLLSASVQTVSLPGQRLQVGGTGRELREVSGVEGLCGEVMFEPGMSGGPECQLLSIPTAPSFSPTALGDFIRSL